MMPQVTGLHVLENWSRGVILKYMINKVYILIRTLSLVVLSVLVSCQKQSEEASAFTISYGIILGNQQAYDVKLDDGSLLNVMQNLVSSDFPVEDSMRVIANYTVIRKITEGSYDVRLNSLIEIPTLQPVFDVDLFGAMYGKDPINVEKRKTWFSQNKYLNVIFTAYADHSNKDYRVNLLVNRKESTDETVVVELRYDAMGAIYEKKECRRVSFDVSGLLPKGSSEIKILMKWTNFEGKTDSISGSFKRYSSDSGIITVTMPD